MTVTTKDLITEARNHAESLRVVMQDQAAETIDTLCTALEAEASKKVVSGEAWSLEILAQHARLEAERYEAGDGSTQAQVAACIEYAAASTAMYAPAGGGPRARAERCLAAEQAVFKQFEHLCSAPSRG